MIPVYAFLFVPARIALAGDYKRFLERTAKIQSGLLICVYCLSYAPALLMLKLPPLANGEPDTGGGVRLLFFFVLIVQLSDALQYAWSQIPSRHVIVPTINATRTWEGLLGGTASVTLIGAVLWWATPFHGASWWMAAVMSAVISLMGFAGGITMSAIKRDRGVKDYGTLVEGHGGVLDRIDSLCFAAPVFFHCTRWFLVLSGVMPPAGSEVALCSRLHGSLHRLVRRHSALSPCQFAGVLSPQGVGMCLSPIRSAESFPREERPRRAVRPSVLGSRPG